MKTSTALKTLIGLVLGLMVFTQAFAQDIADNVVIVLDASGSMAQPLPRSGTDKMTAAKAALKKVLKTVPENTHIGLLVFSAKDLKDDWVYPLGPRDDARLTQAIDRLQPHGSTPLGAYLKKGADRLLEERAKQFGYGTFRLLAVTDGEASDQPLVERFTPEIIARGVTVDVIGVNMSQRHTLATKVHSYRSANDAGSLQRAVAEVFGEIGGSSKDVTSAEAFAELKSIPAEVAQAMIQALAVSGNQPIGERAQRSPAPPAPAPRSQGAVTPQPQPSSPPAHAVAHTSARSVALGSTIGGLACFGFFALIILGLIIRVLKKSRR